MKRPLLWACRPCLEPKCSKVTIKISGVKLLYFSAAETDFLLSVNISIFHEQKGLLHSILPYSHTYVWICFHGHYSKNLIFLILDCLQKRNRKDNDKESSNVFCFSSCVLSKAQKTPLLSGARVINWSLHDFIGRALWKWHTLSGPVFLLKVQYLEGISIN